MIFDFKICVYLSDINLQIIIGWIKFDHCRNHFKTCFWAKQNIQCDTSKHLHTNCIKGLGGFKMSFFQIWTFKTNLSYYDPLVNYITSVKDSER